MGDKAKWEEALELLPDIFQDTVGKDVREAIAEQQAQLEGYADYSELIGKHKPEELSNALTYSQRLESDPQLVLKELGDYLQQRGVDTAELLGIEKPKEPASPPKVDPDDTAIVDPRLEELSKNYKQLTEQYGQIGKYISDKEQFETAQAQEKALNKMLDDLEKQVTGEEKPWDRDYVINRIAQGDTPDAAVKHLHGFVGKFGAGVPKKETPIVLGSGSLPSNQKSVTELSDSQVEDLVAANPNLGQNPGY